MTTFSERMREARRLEILRLLGEAPGYEVAAEVIHMGLPDRGLSASDSAITADLFWLEEQGLVELTKIAGVNLARITRRGLDAGAGRAVVPGVRRPLPED